MCSQNTNLKEKIEFLYNFTTHMNKKILDLNNEYLKNIDNFIKSIEKKNPNLSNEMKEYFEETNKMDKKIKEREEDIIGGYEKQEIEAGDYSLEMEQKCLENNCKNEWNFFKNRGEYLTWEYSKITDYRYKIINTILSDPDKNNYKILFNHHIQKNKTASYIEDFALNFEDQKEVYRQYLDTSIKEDKVDIVKTILSNMKNFIPDLKKQKEIYKHCLDTSIKEDEVDIVKTIISNMENFIPDSKEQKEIYLDCLDTSIREGKADTTMAILSTTENLIINPVFFENFIHECQCNTMISKDRKKLLMFYKSKIESAKTLAQFSIIKPQDTNGNSSNTLLANKKKESDKERN